jgi:hypothetical protein
MSREDRLRRILGQAPPEPAKAPEPPPAVTPELPAARNVLDHPLRSRFLDQTAPVEIKPGAIDGASLLGRALAIGPHVAAVTLILTLVVLSMLGRQTLVYAEVGRAACAAGPTTVPEYTCTAGAVGCFTIEQEAVITAVRDQAHERNMTLMGCAKVGLGL